MAIKSNFLADTEINLLNLQQIQDDIFTLMSIAKFINKKSYGFIFILNTMPYFSMSIYEAYKYLEENNLNKITSFNKNERDLIFDSRLKIKFFEKSRYAESVTFLNNIALFNKLYFDMCPRFKIISKIFNLCDIGIYFINDQYIGNSQLAYMFFQNKDLYKQVIQKNIMCSKEFVDGKKLIKIIYNGTDYSLDTMGKRSYEYGYLLGVKITEIFRDVKIARGIFSLEEFENTYTFQDFDHTITSKDFHIKKMKPALFGNLTNDTKAFILYILHLYCILNFIDKVFNVIVPEKFHYNLRVKYNCLHYVIYNLKELYKYWEGNNLLNSEIKSFYKVINIDFDILFKNEFTNYVRHYDFRDKNHNLLISESRFDKSKPYFGLIESSFNGMSYLDLQSVINSKTTVILEVLKEWLGVC